MDLLEKAIERAQAWPVEKRNEAAEILGITSNTVASHLKSIYGKLNVSNRAQATLEALKLGLVRP